MSERRGFLDFRFKVCVSLAHKVYLCLSVTGCLLLFLGAFLDFPENKYAAYLAMTVAVGRKLSPLWFGFPIIPVKKKCVAFDFVAVKGYVVEIQSGNIH